MNQFSALVGTFLFTKGIKYRPFHKTLPRYSELVNWISVRFYEMDCSLDKKLKKKFHLWKGEFAIRNWVFFFAPVRVSKQFYIESLLIKIQLNKKIRFETVFETSKLILVKNTPRTINTPRTTTTSILLFLRDSPKRLKL